MNRCAALKKSCGTSRTNPLFGLTSDIQRPPLLQHPVTSGCSLKINQCFLGIPTMGKHAVATALLPGHMTRSGLKSKIQHKVQGRLEPSSGSWFPHQTYLLIGGTSSTVGLERLTGILYYGWLEEELLSFTRQSCTANSRVVDGWFLLLSETPCKKKLSPNHQAPSRLVGAASLKGEGGPVPRSYFLGSAIGSL